MEKITIYGKGGIGKSFIASNLSLTYAKKGFRVLHIGCDPKQDSTISLLQGEPPATVLDIILQKGKDNLTKEDIINQGVGGVDCIESGGPEPGVGCAGYGISLTFEVLNRLNIITDNKYDIVIYDVLGDVVCGGFAAPLRLGFGKKTIVVVSEELMSLYAANNIFKAINRHKSNGIYLSGLILNQKNNNSSLDHLKIFAKKTNSSFIGKIPRSDDVVMAEKLNLPIVEQAPESEVSKVFLNIAKRILDQKAIKTPPTPIDYSSLQKILKKLNP